MEGEHDVELAELIKTPLFKNASGRQVVALGNKTLLLIPRWTVRMLECIVCATVGVS